MPSSDLHGAQVVVAGPSPSFLALIDGLLEEPGARAADVEGTHGELRAGLADGLGGDDADRLAELDQLAGGQVACRSTWRRRRACDSQVSTERILSCSMPILSIVVGRDLVDELIRA